MAGYDPQRSRRRPSAAETGAAPVDSLLGAVPGGETAPLPASPAVTPPPPTPDPDPRLVKATAVGVVLALMATLLLVRRWWRGRRA
ncbi:MAG: hypothetical protein OES57_10680 [Acidimicrobiia bacterium]|nr:hypothetical protein [Acidimicrobiia bacterium]